jgi:hypothetical protein
MNGDNHALCNSLIYLTSRSLVMMVELRSFWCLLDRNIINMRARYIRSVANVWANKLNRHLDNYD